MTLQSAHLICVKRFMAKILIHEKYFDPLCKRLTTHLVLLAPSRVGEGVAERGRLFEGDAAEANEAAVHKHGKVDVFYRRHVLVQVHVRWALGL